ncbi:hypothetical protein CHS0354_035617 [Potamilus streckersoni]|uniref:Uncharacterized protein n=1 Tax=Potamilus streckersoni TaxID=2493646 RepID=A0AAE0VI24_9BIVA|nr:hypothetical protein CHS0354_035617 [Potamilus streckersoni]
MPNKTKLKTNIGSDSITTWNRSDSTATLNKSDPIATWNRSDSTATWNRSHSKATWNRYDSTATWNRSDSTATWNRSHSIDTWNRSHSIATWNRLSNNHFIIPVEYFFLFAKYKVNYIITTFYICSSEIFSTESSDYCTATGSINNWCTSLTVEP